MAEKEEVEKLYENDDLAGVIPTPVEEGIERLNESLDDIKIALAGIEDKLSDIKTEMVGLAAWPWGIIGGILVVAYGKEILTFLVAVVGFLWIHAQSFFQGR